MRLSSSKVGTHQDLKTSSGLIQKQPFSTIWNLSKSPTCFHPLHVFVYGHHGEETFFCSQRNITKPGHATQLQSKPIRSLFNSIHPRVWPGLLFDVRNSYRRSTDQRQSRRQLWFTNSSSTCLHQRDTTRPFLILHNNIGLVNNNHHREKELLKATTNRTHTSLWTIWRKWIQTHAAH